MNKEQFNAKLKKLNEEHENYLSKLNPIDESKYNGIVDRYKNPILTAKHAPLSWRYDFDFNTNPFLQERIGVNATFNSGAIFKDGKYLLAVRVEGDDRKSFIAIAESDNGIDNFRFWDYPILLPETNNPDINVYDMRLVQHEDGWIYGLFCTERKDPNAKVGDTSSAIAGCGIVRTKYLKEWERLDDLISYSGQQRNVVLHPEFIESKYAFYTRPQDGFIDTGSGGGIGWGLSESIVHAEVKEEVIIDNKEYHTIYEVKNGLGPAPIKTSEGWLHLAHGVRNTAAGLRYVLYMFLADINDPKKIIHKPAGYFMAPIESERVGDVSNVLFSNGWIEKDGKVFIYYASSDTRMHVATSTIERLLDYVKNTPEDGLRSHFSVKNRIELISKNLNSK